MSERKKKLLSFAVFVIAVILIILFLKKNPQIIKQLEKALGPVTIGTFNIPELTAETPRDYPLPAIGDFWVAINSGCNFCATKRQTITPPAMPVSTPATPTQVSFNPQPFGGSAYMGGAIYTVPMQVGNFYIPGRPVW